jgi:hypothetical protein
MTTLTTTATHHDFSSTRPHRSSAPISAPKRFSSKANETVPRGGSPIPGPGGSNNNSHNHSHSGNTHTPAKLRRRSSDRATAAVTAATATATATLKGRDRRASRTLHRKRSSYDLREAFQSGEEGPRDVLAAAAAIVVGGVKPTTTLTTTTGPSDTAAAATDAPPTEPREATAEMMDAERNASYTAHQYEVLLKRRRRIP